MEHLECVFCKKKYRLDPFNTFCPECHEPLLYHLPQRKRRFFIGKACSLEKFLDFLPLSKINKSLCLGEGNTPLIKLEHLMKKYGLAPVFAKNETFLPTGSFKDRGTSVAIQKAVSLGIERIGTVSTGNMASSTAAFGAKAGLRTFILVKEDISVENLLSSGIYSPVQVKVKGDYGELFYKSFSLGKKYSICFMNSVDPFRIEGYKVTGFEIFLQLNRQPPRYIIVPLSSGGHLIGLMKSFLDLKQQGLIQRLPIFVGVQAQGCSPVARAFALRKSKVKRIETASTIAHSISNPAPPGGNIVLKWIKENNGIILSVTDDEILSAQKMLAELEGIFCQPGSATTLAGLLKLSKKLKFTHTDQDNEIILIITGSGLKTVKALESNKMNIYCSSLSNLDETMKSILG